jgi:hypothetical protein
VQYDLRQLRSLLHLCSLNPSLLQMLRFIKRTAGAVIDQQAETTGTPELELAFREALSKVPGLPAWYGYKAPKDASMELPAARGKRPIGAAEVSDCCAVCFQLSAAAPQYRMHTVQ